MSYQTGNADDYQDLLDKLRRFVCGYASFATPVYTGTGNGTLDGFDTQPGAPSETWTLTCTAEDPDGGTFSVVGSVSGAQADATVGTPYSNSYISFTITDGSIDFVIDDEWSIDTTEGDIGSEAWEEQRWVEGDELILKGPGLAGLDEIYVGIKTYEDAGPGYYNWRLMGSTGFNDGMDFDEQPGVLDLTHPRVHLWDTTIPYWFVANGRRIVMVAKVSTRYEALYLGFLLPDATPGQYPYPLAVGGSSTAYGGERYDVESGDHSHFANPGGFSPTRASLCLRTPAGGWKAVRNKDSFDDYYIYPERSVWPFFGMNTTYGYQRMETLREGLDGTYPMIPLTIHADTPDKEILGDLEGCFWVTGYGNSAENIVEDGSDDYFVIQNVYRTTIDEYWALKLE